MKKHCGAYGAAFLFFPLSIIWLESIVKISAFGTLFDRGFDFIVLFSLPLGLLCALLGTLWGGRANRIVSGSLLGLLTLWAMVQTVYFKLFRRFLVLDTLQMAGQALSDYWRETISGIVQSLLPLLFLAVPFVLLCALGRKFLPKEKTGLRAAIGLLAAALILQFLAGFAVDGADDGILSPKVLYRETFVPELSVQNFGIMTTLRLDAKNLLSAGEKSLAEKTEDTTALPQDTQTESMPEVTTEPPVVYAPNVMDIDFDTLLAETEDETLLDMHSYFSQKEPTLQNEYTGLFAGKNLIFITAEGFWRYAVDEKLTPTLYKLTREGFVFENFYTPLWWKSTTDGEFAACMGLIPSANFRAFNKSANNTMAFCLGNQLGALGYETRAYHNHTYTYYDRDQSHPNMGYVYQGLGNGLKVKKTWPESDLEMMQLTIPETLAGEMPFHNYYMTVSGHRDYFFNDNMMSNKYRDEVNAVYPEASEEYRAYKACQMELDRALEYILAELEAAGQIENTVICLSADHYPYGMDPDTWTELAGEELDTDFDIYRSNLILWSGDMEEPVVIEKPCDSTDILATLSNLFGLSYDSRLLMGRDILAEEEGLVAFSDYSFLTEKGRYNAKTDTFTPYEGITVGQDYVLSIYQQVRDMFAYSEMILEEDYYAQIGLGTPDA